MLVLAGHDDPRRVSSVAECHASVASVSVMVMVSVVSRFDALTEHTAHSSVMTVGLTGHSGLVYYWRDSVAPSHNIPVQDV
jgi:hypothetical protein